MTTVATQMISPVGRSEVGARQPRAASQPAPAPAKNGHAVCASPAAVNPSSWLRRPAAQNTRMQTISAAIATGSARLLRAGALSVKFIARQNNS